MAALLLEPSVMPFTVALALLFGLLLLELIAAVLGGSLMGMDADADLDVDIDFDVDFDVADAVDWETDINAAATDVAGADAGGSTDWLGLSKVPTLIWIAAALLGFGLTGLVIQTAAQSIIGTALSPWAVAIPAAAASVWFSSRFSGVFARFIPKSESSAVSSSRLGRRRGVVSQGTAARGKPAEVRVMDSHGNAHYLRAEPLRDDDQIPQGTEVLVMRKSRDEGYRLIALT